MFAADKAGKASGPSDPYFYDVSLLLTGDGTNGAQNNTFLDSSTNNFTITRNGNTTQGSFSPYGSLWSNYFSSSYLLAGTNAAFQFSTNALTVEAWVYTATTGLQCIFDNRLTDGTSAGFFFGLSGSNALMMYTGGATTSGGTVTANTWNHVALVRNGSTITLYLNGTSVASVANSANLSDGNSQIGASTTVTSSSSNYFNGYISNLRVVKGTALYTSNFTPSTTPLTAVSGTSLLTCQSNRFIDNSSNNFALTVSGTPSVQRFSPFNPTASYTTATIGGSGYFDGSGDYLVASSATTALSGDFTVEFWWYPLTAMGGYCNFTGSATYDAHNYFGLNGSTWMVEIGAGEQTLGTFNGQVYAWQHVALVRSGSSIKLYINGVGGTAITNSNSWTRSGGTDIGGYGSSSFPMKAGYLSDYRVLNGTALYTTNFTPPTAPLTAISGTSLLCNMTNAGIYDSAMMNDLETVGNAQISTSVKKYGTGSMYFDGAGDYIVSPTFGSTNSPSAIYSPNGAFTVECWINPTDRSSRSVVGYGTSSTIWVLQFDGSNHIQFKWVNTSPTVYIAVSTSTIPTGSWTHVAATYDGTSIKVFVNGTLEATTATSGTLRSVSSPILGVGSWGGSFSDPTYYGYIDDLRITNGYARYTSNFTPPAQAFPTF